MGADRAVLPRPLPPRPGWPPLEGPPAAGQRHLWHLHTGAPWPDTPERYGPWHAVYDRFNRWRKDGTWARILDALLLQLDERGLIRRDLWCFDGTTSRAHAAAAGGGKKS